MSRNKGNWGLSNCEIVITLEINRDCSKWWGDKTRLHELPWKLSFISHLGGSVVLREDIYGNAYTCSHIRYASVLCLAAWLTLNFVAPSLWRTHLVCQLPQVAPSNKWSWVRADNTGHVDLVNLSRGILQNPCDTGWEVLRSTNTTFRWYFKSSSNDY